MYMGPRPLNRSVGIKIIIWNVNTILSKSFRELGTVSRESSRRFILKGSRNPYGGLTG